MAPARCRAPLALVVLFVCSRVTAESPPREVERSEYRARRLSLVEGLRADLPPGDTGVLILGAAPEREFATYRQESNLFYLTGAEIPGSALVLLFDRPGKPRRGAKRAEPGRYAEYLYLPERDYRQERWTGARPGSGGLVQETLQPDSDRLDAMRATGFDQAPEGDYPPRNYPRGPIERSSDLPAHLNRFLAGAEVLFHRADPVPPGEPLSPDLAFLKEIRVRFPFLTVRDPDRALGRLRMIKSPAEIELLRRAVRITCQAQLDAWDQVGAGIAEYQIQAVIEHRFGFEGARRPGYPSIVGSGPNSCVLHYDASERTLRPGDLLLMDVGAEYRRYSADVTRTVPVDGRFTAEQRKIYEIVLKAQKAAMAIIRPGVPFSEIHRTAREVIEQAGYGPYFIHGTSHFLGLDVHDAGDTSAALQPGMVLTVEPGIYIAEKQLGVRIEDDVLVTPEGFRILSDCLPREADAVEMQMSKGLRPGSR